MPNNGYFLHKKSLLDRFKDDHSSHTGYIQSARAKHTWNNPLTRRKRTKELNGWIKSFAGKRHIHKLSRFNAVNAGRYESLQVVHPDVEFDCLRYGSTLELPNGVCVPVRATIRCLRRGAFTFRVMGFGEADPDLYPDAGNAKCVIHGYYPVYGPERKPSDEFDIYCDDVSELQKWSDCNGWGMGVGPSASSMELAREVAKGKKTMRNEDLMPIHRNLCFTFDVPADATEWAVNAAKNNENVIVIPDKDYTNIYVNTIDELVDFLDSSEDKTLSDSFFDITAFHYATINSKWSRCKPADIEPWAKKWHVYMEVPKYAEDEIILAGSLDDVGCALGDCGF